MKNYKTIIAAVVAALACSAATTEATMTVSPGGTVNAPLGGYALTGGSLTLVNQMSSVYSFGADTGTLISSVYSGDTANSLGGYTFVYTISMTGGDIATLELGGYTLPSVVVANLTTGIGLNGATSTGSSSVNYGTLGVLNFYWSPSVGPGGNPQTLSVVVDTSVKYDAPSMGALIDTGSENLGILAPVPEPTTIVAGALMLLPLGIGVARSLRKERAA